ncbi:ABC transporter permease subunit [Mesorhizobium sp.]|uniref:amino acid ABC transporter permease n=1 Tax=Mesorhizobium sp. TaxID=1871066 RepID=UPI000FE5D1A1|nr:ABC transporter permease subunit [Mesorhizobium sp.]RWK43144.1 MAG: ABC transporter permease subunit [Mesorhizobium sp.]RWK71335.1 MAG: ABC transporter permease subunit [Mesorhizobium sp.]RWK77748.1 MAG: ABC transporter permease subunit [Mesorhizobium sp.]RWK83485.1 MAG: ABC transporter permease subunit [Mesorhizobium sp.]RWL07160.1 MAG: ABC transporter permease subunit [Mesorhizobium sp.]
MDTARRFSWSDARLRSTIWQVLVVGLVLAGIFWFVANALHNLESRRIASGFGFLASEAGLPIGEHLISYTPADTYSRALAVGIINTLRVALTGIVLASVLGTLIGIARLSRNWLLSRLSGIYVEVVRDLPLLLQLLLVYAVLQGLPGPRQALSPLPGTYLTNRGLYFPTLEVSQPVLLVFATFAIGVLASFAYTRWSTARRVVNGKRLPFWPVVLPLVVGLPLATSFIAGAEWVWNVPSIQGFNFRGGANLSPEYFALLFGLVVYTSAFIAEIVRSGILAVSKGQWESAAALGLSKGQTLRLIVVPQGLRVIIPPVTSQYLNLVKNSSLAVAIGFQDIVSITNTVINQTGQAVEGIAIIMAVYLTISLSISMIMNWYNKRIALTER